MRWSIVGMMVTIDFIYNPRLCFLYEIQALCMFSIDLTSHERRQQATQKIHCMVVQD